MSSMRIPEEDKEWLAAVGLMAIYWADMEIMMDTYLACLIRQPEADPLWPDGAQDTKQALELTFNKRIRLWKDVVPLLPLDEATRKQNIDLAERARDARNHRDLLLHGETRKGLKGMVANHLPKKRGQKIQEIPYPPEKVLKVAREIQLIHSNLLYLLVNYGLALGQREAQHQILDGSSHPRGSHPSSSKLDKP